MSRQGVLVLGFPRSGTSATTAALAQLGLSPGTTATLKGPGVANERGFWEQRPLSHLNARILEHLGGGKWSAPPDLPPGWLASPRLEEDRREGMRLFEEIFPAEPWVWKDARNCLLLPFWMLALDLQPAIVLVDRHPLESAESLARIDHGTSKPLALAAWERYMRHALAGCHGLPVFVTRYADLVGDPGRWRTDALAFLKLCGLAGDSSTATPSLDTIDPGLRHCSVGRGAVADEVLSPEQAQLQTLLERIVGAHSSFAPPDLPAETAHADWLIAERRRADIEIRELTEHFSAKLTGQAAKAARRREQYASRIDRQRRKIEQLRARNSSKQTPEDTRDDRE